MNECCCCRCIDWCVRHCCPGLNSAGKKPPYPGIQYSLIDDEEKPLAKETSAEKEPVKRVQPSRATHRRPPRPQMHFTLLQDGAHFSLHPQMGVSFGESWPVTEQPSPDHFLRRFSLSEVDPGAAMPEQVTSPVNVPSLPVYREKALRGHGASSDSTIPIIQFSLHYDIHQSKLRVHLQHASDLPKVLHKGRPVRCDPFIMLHLEPDRQDTLQSEVIKNSYDPKFNEIVQFGGLSVDDIKLQTLVLRLYNSALNNKAIGRVCLPLRDVDLFGVVVQMKIIETEEMESNFQGDLLISLSYSPVSRKLSGIISKATGLRKHDLLGKADPYVKVIVSFKDTIVFKWKSTVKHNTLAPVYNESFNCKVTEEISEAMDHVTVSFYIVDFDYVLRNDTMGLVTVGTNVQSKLGRKHWTQVLQSPRQGISFWHSIQLATSAQKRHMRSRSSSPLPQ